METTTGFGMVEGTREELIVELRRLAEGWDHLGKPAKAREAQEGVNALLTGSTSIRVGHTHYDVTEG